MPSINAIYGGNYINAKTAVATGLIGQELTMKNLRTEEISGDTKLVTSFAENDKHLAFNKTNASLVADKHGENYSQWEGKKIRVELTKRAFQGTMVDAIQTSPV